METLSCHSNQSICEQRQEKRNFVEANTMNNSAKFQFYPLMASEELMFLYFIRKVSLSVAMATNQIEGFGLNWYVW